MKWSDATPSTLRPGYLDRRALEHLVSNISDCFADPGDFPVGVAVRAMELHERCSLRCQVRARATEVLAPRDHKSNWSDT